MTTKVTVDAHAGWPVQVIRRGVSNNDGSVGYTEQRVEPYTEQTFHVWDGSTLEVIELKGCVERVEADALSVACRTAGEHANAKSSTSGFAESIGPRCRSKRKPSCVGVNGKSARC